MRGRQIRLAIAVLGTIVAVVGESMAYASGRRASDVLLDLAIGLTYLYGGLAIWDHEPANRTGRLMTLVGLTWFIGTLTSASIPIVSELALAFEDTFDVVLVALVLAYPSGRLETRVDRIAVWILAVGATALNTLYSTSLTIVADKSSGLYGGLALVVMSTAVIIRRWIIAPARSRPELLPVLVAGVVFLTTLVINIIRRIVDVPRRCRGRPRRGERSGPGRRSDRPADRVLPSKRTPSSGRRRCDPRPRIPVRSRWPLSRRQRRRHRADVADPPD